MNKITLTFNMNLDHYKLLITTRTQSLRWELFELTKPSCAAQVSYLKPHCLTVLSTPVACHIKLSFVGQLQVILKFSNIIVKNHCQICQISQSVLAHTPVTSVLIRLRH